MIANLLLDPIERGLNKAIQTDPNSLSRLKEIDGTRFKIILTDLNITLICEAKENHIHCYLDDDCICHVKIEGTSLSFLQSFLAGNDAISAKKFSLHMQGDPHTAQAWQQLFSQCDIDWQTLLENKIGEQPAYHAIKTFSFIKRKLNETKHKLMSDTAEYLKHEKKVLVPNHLVKHFSTNVTSLQQDVDRLEARLMRLERAHHD